MNHQRKSSKVIQTAVFMHKNKLGNYYWSNRKACHRNSGIFKHVCVRSCPVVSDSLRPHGLWLTRFLHPWGFSRQEYWSGLLCPPPGDLPNPRIKPRCPSLQADSLPSEPRGKPWILLPEWVAYPCPRGSSWPPGVKPGPPALYADSLPAELQGKTHIKAHLTLKIN